MFKQKTKQNLWIHAKQGDFAWRIEKTNSEQFLNSVTGYFENVCYKWYKYRRTNVKANSIIAYQQSSVTTQC